MQPAVRTFSGSHLGQHCGAGVRRELYLCDDGKDPTKRVWLETTYGQGSHNSERGKVHYVSGRCALRLPQGL
jgi:hypothetical protein